MTETDLAIIAALRAGVTKARRDATTAAAFLVGKTDPEFGHPIWATLATDVPGFRGWGGRTPTAAEQAEHDAYKRIQGNFMRRWMAANYNPGFTVVEVDRDDLIEALRTDGAAGLQRLIAEQQGGPSPEQIARWARARQANLDAGKCLGCGGSTTEDGSCVGDGDDDYEPDNDSTLRREVSETGVRYLPVDSEPAEVHAEIDATITRLRAHADQLRAEDDELFRLTGEHDSGLAYKIGRIDAEIIKLTGNINDAKGI